MKNLFNECPICGGKVTVSKLQCNKCNTSFENDFYLNELNKLNANETRFVISFLKNDGNIKAMENEYNISYPTVKARLNEIKEKLGVEEKQSSSDILDKLSSGEISVDSAINLIKEKK